MPMTLRSTLLSLSLLALMSLALFPAMASAQRSTTPDYDYLPPAEVEKITLGDAEQAVLVRPWQGRNQYGAAVLLGDLGEDADPEGLLAFLRRELTPKGWATLSIGAPQGAAQPNHITDAGEIPKPGEQQLSQKSNQSLPKYSQEDWAALREQQKTVMSQTLGQLDSLGKSYPGKRILIVTGQSAGLVIEMLTAATLPSPDLLVVINPYLEQDEENRDLPGKLAKLALPVLDIQSPDGLPASLATQKARKALSPLGEPLRYEQQQLALNLDQPSAWQDVLTLVQGFAQRILRAYP
ncbi:alpha/beta hydrolase family protein [Shewanella alkalitolerans]|uniref:DUF3530 family protein n=1 Tax=Shewanella alkalitolerans TaxID=2864209 RepID=UPI001C654D3E|nr:DUF3530 family protein [Shewanella alkalitolerans]QYJ98107.1 alpha/beta hydrolase family protein [Shewanella alkalitolerans]